MASLPSPVNFTRCRVCGYNYEPDYFPWDASGESPTFDICQGCGVEFGYQDTNLVGILAQRNDYLKSLPRSSQLKVAKDIAQLPSQFREGSNK